jgi:hypothetical protein
MTRAPTGPQPAIARRVAEAKATVPDTTADAELGMDAVIAVQLELVDGLGPDEAPRVRDFSLKACGLALGGVSDRQRVLSRWAL